MTKPTANRFVLFLLVAGIAAGLGFAYFPTLRELAAKWSRDPNHSHGFLIPLFSGYLLWLRRDYLGRPGRNRYLLASLIVCGGAALRFVSGYFAILSLDILSLLVTLAGLVLLFGGTRWFLWGWPALAYLAFIVPLPYRWEISLSWPLQRVATLSSAYLLQTVGVPALAEGNLILIDDKTIGIVEACSGLRMLTVFFALSTALVIVKPLPAWQKAAILLSAAPIALASNIIRITVTSVCLYLEVGVSAETFLHDLAGWIMMPIAIVLLCLEMVILSRCIVRVEPVKA